MIGPMNHADVLRFRSICKGISENDILDQFVKIFQKKIFQVNFKDILDQFVKIFQNNLK